MSEAERELVARQRSFGIFDRPRCESMVGCPDWDHSAYKRWIEEEIEAGRDPFPPPEPASNCVGFCFNAIVESVDEENWRVAKVAMIRKNGKRTPAVVERTRIAPSSRGPAAKGEPVRYACFTRVRGKDGLGFESCSQMTTLR